jgi:hypothetical protein
MKKQLFFQEKINVAQHQLMVCFIDYFMQWDINIQISIVNGLHRKLNRLDKQI